MDELVTQIKNIRSIDFLPKICKSFKQVVKLQKLNVAKVDFGSICEQIVFASVSSNNKINVSDLWFLKLLT